MSKYQVSRRLQFLIQYIYDKEYASKEDILEFLNEKDFNISTRTLERDFEKIKSDFGIELSYKKQKNGYYIDEEKSVKVDSFFRFLELVSIADVFRDGMANNQKLLNYVEFDDSSHLKGIENLNPILTALKQNRDIEFTHYNFHRNTYTPKSISPLIIKEYINRWYVVGVPEKSKEIRTFGIDRMTDIKIGELTKINKDTFLNQINKFKDIIGLNFSSGEPVKVVIKAMERHIKYLESLPLHPSQTIEASSEKGFFMVSYFLIPNYEFKIELLKMAIETEVVEPKWFRDEIKKEVAEIHNKYQD